MLVNAKQMPDWTRGGCEVAGDAASRGDAIRSPTCVAVVCPFYQHSRKIAYDVSAAVDEHRTFVMHPAGSDLGR